MLETFDGNKLGGTELPMKQEDRRPKWCSPLKFPPKYNFQKRLWRLEIARRGKLYMFKEAGFACILCGENGKRTKKAKKKAAHIRWPMYVYEYTIM